MITRPTISVADFAFRSRLRYQRALDMVLAGEVEGVREGRHWLVYADAVDAFIANRRAAQPAGAAA